MIPKNAAAVWQDSLVNLENENEHDDPACFKSAETKYIMVIIAGLTRKKSGQTSNTST